MPSGYGPILKRHVARYLTGLLLVAVMVRALVPAGFMPDFQSGPDGTFKIVICTANGFKVISTDAGDDPSPRSDHGHDVCAFAATASLALLVPEVAETPRPHVSLLVQAIPAEVVLPPARAGPQLGSRGPPKTV